MGRGAEVQQGHTKCKTKEHHILHFSLNFYFKTHILILQMLGCHPGGPFGPLDGGQMELLRLLDKGQKGFLGLGVRARIATESLECKTKSEQTLHFL